MTAILDMMQHLTDPAVLQAVAACVTALAGLVAAFHGGRIIERHSQRPAARPAPRPPAPGVGPSLEPPAFPDAPTSPERPSTKGRDDNA